MPCKHEVASSTLAGSTKYIKAIDSKHHKYLLPGKVDLEKVALIYAGVAQWQSS